ncbi:hypothetical protein [Streptomyces lateritius]|uniref:hypothetical protein n=1 Tax=Streptomyces lateritius TaxID=67313 RepID=UPI001673B031|nr:hypothetical protein [Streptomyces lateritius]GGT90827.1 hypothetical protein GCM10010272_39520 [Streptomyces lateritius]
MAEATDGGSSGGTPGFIPPIVGGVFGVAAAAKKLVVELGEMDSLKKRVDKLLEDFGTSQAGPAKIGDEWLDKDRLGGPGFKEAEFLYGSYNVVRDQLVKFSKVLELQMESMKLAIHASQNGYQSIDDDIRARMKRLNSEIADIQKRDDQRAGAKGMGGSSDQPLPQEKSSAGGESDY